MSSAVFAIIYFSWIGSTKVWKWWRETSYSRENENLAGRLYSRSGPLTTFRLNCSPKVENILVKFGNLSNPLQFKFQFFSLEKKIGWFSRWNYTKDCPNNLGKKFGVMWFWACGTETWKRYVNTINTFSVFKENFRPRVEFLNRFCPFSNIFSH